MTRFRAHPPIKWTVTMTKRLPDEHEAIEGAGVASATAVGLLKDADLLVGAGSYGTAVSLAVLGFEESVKARTLGAIAAAAAMGSQVLAGSKDGTASAQGLGPISGLLPRDHLTTESGMPQASSSMSRRRSRACTGS